MRKGLTLIELIFTIIIIAMVFTVIPKVVISLNKSDSFTIRQDGLFAGTSFVSMASNLLWDNQNSDYLDIVHVSSTDFTCNPATKYRIGGFLGSRQCENNLTSFALGSDGESGYESYNDIDDYYNSPPIPIKDYIGDTLYELNVTVEFLPDTIGSTVVYNSTNASATIDLRNLSSSPLSTNLKHMKVDVIYSGKRGEKRQITQFDYVSPNLGYTSLNKRTW